MTGYIYQIENLKTGKSYIGQTVDFNRRKRTHLNKLQNGTHCNPHLQSAYNLYGEQEFHWRVWKFDNITEEELNQKEIEFIKKYDSINNGYNIADGGGKPPKNQKVDDKILSICLCILFKYDKVGKPLERILKYSSGTMSALKTRKRYPNAWSIYESYSEEERNQLAQKYYNEWEVEENKISAAIRRGNGKLSSKTITITQEELNNIYAARELGYGYTCLGLYYNINPSTVKDWVTGRARSKNLSVYNSLSDIEKEKIKNKLPVNDFQKLENKKEKFNRVTKPSK